MIVPENPASEGSPESQASPQAASHQPPVVVYSPVPTPPAPPPTGGSNALKIVLIVVAVFVVLGILAVGAIGFIGWRISRSIHVSQTTGETTISTPGGTISTSSTENFTAADLGTDIYPGAQAAKGGMRMTLPTGSMITAIYTTSDSKDQVVSYYKSKFGSEAAVFDTSDGAMLTLNKSKQESVMVTVTSKPNENNGKTRIAIVHTTSTKPS